MIFSADMSSSVHIDNKQEDILILGKGPSDRLDDTILMAEKEYSINFTKQQRMFCFCLQYNGSNSCIFANGAEICKFKEKESEINGSPLCLGNASRDCDFYDFFTNIDVTAAADVLDIHQYLMKEHDIK